LIPNRGAIYAQPKPSLPTCPTTRIINIGDIALLPRNQERNVDAIVIAAKKSLGKRTALRKASFIKFSFGDVINAVPRLLFARFAMNSRPDIPAEMRRAVLMEAGFMCAVSRCSVGAVDIHHIDPYREVRRHTLENLIALCPNHHRLAEDGKIDRKSLKLYKRELSLRNLPAPQVPGEERTRFCKLCACETLQIYKVQTHFIFFISRYWECRCGYIQCFENYTLPRIFRRGGNSS